ncbi:hypothetical protein LZC95_50650 [Pendulispora brunnea]|uniref:NHL repeat-containing protein n=1 Tax=Pendulispora brunnea TaxID=2905690 RepID=A0ABZ2K7K2_9BACT
MKRGRRSYRVGMGLLVSCGGLLSCAGILGIEDLKEQSGSGLSVAFVSGTGQSGEVGKELAQPLVVEVHDANGALASNRSVTFTASAGGGYFVADVVVTTDAQGRAQTRWVLGPAARNEITADAEGAKASTTATSTNPWQLGIFAGLPVGRMFRDGNAQDARFGDPSGLAVGADGKVYIGDGIGHSLRRYDPATQQVITLAGINGVGQTRNGVGSAAGFVSPYGLTFDGNGRLIVASAYAHKIARVDLGNVDVTYFAGTGVAGTNPKEIDVANAHFNVPYALDWDASRNVVYVAENGNHDVREIDLASSLVRTIAGQPGVSGPFADGAASSAVFSYPMGITHIGSKVYVSDYGHCRIRVLDLGSSAGPTVSTLSGGNGCGAGFVDGTDGSTSGLVSPAAITNAGGFLYVADRGAHAIRRVDVSNGAVVTIAGSPPSAGAPKFGARDGQGTSALFFRPQGIAATPDGKALYVGEAGGTDLRRIDLTSGTYDVTTVAAKAVVPTDGDARTQAVLSSPRGIALAGGKLVIGENQGNDIRVLDLASNRVQRIAGPVDEAFGTRDGTGDVAQFAFPVPMIADDAEGVVYVAGGDQRIRQVKVDTGVTSSVAGKEWERSFADGVGEAARFTDPAGFALDAKGRKLYIADQGNHRVRVLDLTTRAVTTVAGSVSGYRDGPGGDARFSLPRGLALKDNVLYVSDTGNHVIRRIELDGKGSGTVTTFAGIPTKAGTVDGRTAEAQFKAPWSIALDGDLLYVADVFSDALRRIHIPSATVSTLVGGPSGIGPTPTAMPQKPAFLQVRPGGEVLFTSEVENVVFRLGP